MTEVVFVCDEGAGVGLGHRRRCEAVAYELALLGIDSVIVPSMQGIVAAPVVVVDSYRARADDRRWIVPDHVVAIDDLDRDLAVDIVVLPAPAAICARHSKAKVVLAGASYSLVDPMLRALDVSQDFEAAGRSARVVVTMGAADHEGVGQIIARRCAERCPDAAVQLVVGPWGDQSTPPGVQPVWCDVGLGDLLAQADVVVTAAGVTLLESLTLGRPTIAVATAANQVANIDAVRAAGAAWAESAVSACDAVAALLADPAARSRLSQRGRALIDGRGAQRVAASVAKLCTTRSAVGT